MLRHSWRLQNWEATLQGAVVDTFWRCPHCGSTSVHVTPEEWEEECLGPSLDEIYAQMEKQGGDDTRTEG